MVAGSEKKMSEKPLTPVIEDYLETIYDLDREKKAVRVKDIARRMSVKMPTVTSMLKNLDDRGLVHYEKYEHVQLTEHGAHIGKEIRERHEVIFRFLTQILKVEEETANEEACRMEHTLSPGTLDNLTDFMKFIQSCPRTGESWLQHYEEFRSHGLKPARCRECGSEFTNEFIKEVESMAGVTGRRVNRRTSGDPS